MAGPIKPPTTSDIVSSDLKRNVPIIWTHNKLHMRRVISQLCCSANLHVADGHRPNGGTLQVQIFGIQTASSYRQLDLRRFQMSDSHCCTCIEKASRGVK